MNRILILLFLFSNNIFGQNFTATVSNKTVSVGEEFQLTFTAGGNSSGFKAPNFIGLRKISGPNKSTSSSMQIINNKVSSSKTTSYTYYLTPLSEGKVTIGSASIKIEGKKSQTEPITINVKKADPNKKSGFNISDNVKVKASVSKTNLYQGEQISVTYKLYSKINLTDISISEFPELNGFWKEKIETNSKGEVKVIDGIKYNVWDVSKSILTPQKSGELIIDPMKLDITVQLKTGNSSRDFFGMFNNYKTVVEEIKSKKIIIKVKDLPPNPPNSFNGAVGNFKLKSSIDKNNIKTNTALNFKLELSGSGNLNLIDEIPVKLSDDFEIFDPQKENKSFISKNGTAGKIIFNHLIIPRFQGQYTIPSQEFTFFDTKSKKYKTLSTDLHTINVTKGSNQESYINTSSQLQNTNNLNPIKTVSKFQKKNKKMFHKQWWFVVLLLSPVLFVLTFLSRKKYFDIIDKNPIKRKYRKSLKIAQKRLKNAEILMKNDKKVEFYEQIEKSLLHYFSQKFNVETSDLSKETIISFFNENNIEEQVLNNFVSIIEDCEYCRFAPYSINSKDVQIVYNKATNIIIEIEKQLN
jgi:hypothetical protein